MGYFISKSKNANLTSLNREGARAGQDLAQGVVCKLNPSDGKLYACTSDGDVAIGVTGQAYSKDASVKLFHSGIIYIPASQLAGSAGDTLFIGANGQLNTDGAITAGYIAESEDGYHHVNLSAFGTEAGEGGEGGGGGSEPIPLMVLETADESVLITEAAWKHSVILMPNEEHPTSIIREITINVPDEVEEPGYQYTQFYMVRGVRPESGFLELGFNDAHGPYYPEEIPYDLSKGVAAFEILWTYADIEFQGMPFQGWIPSVTISSVGASEDGGGNTPVPFRLYTAESQDVSLPESLFGHSLFIMADQGSDIQSITMNAPSDTPELGTQIIVSLLIASGGPSEDGIALQFNSPIIQLGATSRVKTYDGVGRAWVLLTYDSISDPEGGVMTGWFVDVLPYEDASVERIAYKPTSSDWNEPLPTTVNQSIHQLLLRLVDVEDGLGGETSKVSTLQGQMTTANTNIGALQGQMATANSDIGSLQSSVATNTSDIAAEKPKVSTLQGEMATANSDIGSLQTSVGALQSSVSTIQSAVDDYNLGIMTYDNTDSGLTATTVKDAIDEIVARLVALEGA